MAPTLWGSLDEDEADEDNDEDDDADPIIYTKELAHQGSVLRIRVCGCM